MELHKNGFHCSVIQYVSQSTMVQFVTFISLCTMFCLCMYPTANPRATSMRLGSYNLRLLPNTKTSMTAISPCTLTLTVTFDLDPGTIYQRYSTQMRQASNLVLKHDLRILPNTKIPMTAVFSCTLTLTASFDIEPVPPFRMGKLTRPHPNAGCRTVSLVPVHVFSCNEDA